MRQMIVSAVMAAGVLAVAPSTSAGSLRDGAHRLLTVTAIGGSTPVTVPVRYDARGDEEVYVPEHGWERCIYGSCTYTVRAYYFDRYEPGPGRGTGRGILGAIIGLD
ncbi:MAG: hypothetical protein R3D57_07030 [Hyphomicrobiaceae bacterium]